MSIEVGASAPDFVLKDQNNQEVRLADFRGRRAVLLVFYPLAFTGTCQGELCQVRDNLNDFVLSANAAFRTDRLRALSGFDEALGPRAGSPMVNDDVDLCRRLVAAGGRIVYVPDAVVVHELLPDRLTPSYLVKRTYAQGRSDWLLERDTNRRRPLGGAKGILVHLSRLLGDRVRDGPWHPNVAVGAALSVVQTTGFLREAAVNRARTLGQRPVRSPRQ